MINKLGLLFAFAVIVLSNTSCEQPKAKLETSDEVIYAASVVKEEHISTDLSLPGELEGYYETGIMAKVNGYIKHLSVDIGDRVVNGQLLAELEAPELMSQMTVAYAEYLAKEALYLNTKGRLKRLTQTNETQGAVSPYDMDLAKTTLRSDSLGFEAAKAKYESVRDLTNYLKISAPFDGIITERPLAPGAFVGPGDKNGLPLFRLKSENKLRLHIAVPEKYLAEIRIGEVVTFHVKSFPEKNFEGKISRLSKNLSVQTRAEIVEIEIENGAGKLLPGMYAVASLPLKREEGAATVPESSVVTNMERSFVIKIKHGKVPMYVDVETGEKENGNLEVFGKLNAGDTVLTVGSDEIKENAAIKIKL